MKPMLRGRSSWRHRALVGGLLLVLAGVAGWTYRANVLQGVARAWIVSDSIEPADAVAVLGGGLDTRPFAAANYYHRGIVSKIVVAAARTSPSERLGITPSPTSLSRDVLLRLGVP